METTSIKMKELEKGRDIDDKLSSNKMELEDTFTEVKAGKDNRSSILHAARFLAGAACASTKLWRRARQVIGLTGHPPVGSYMYLLLTSYLGSYLLLNSTFCSPVLPRLLLSDNILTSYTDFYLQLTSHPSFYL